MTKMRTCRACKAADPYLCLPLGEHPPANSFLRADQLDQPELRASLDVHACLRCGLIQVPDNVPEGFFRDYLYVPSAADTMHAHFGKFADLVVKGGFLGPAGDGLVADIGCNDGLFLGKCLERGARVLGIDPADNITVRAKEKGVPIVPEYFGAEVGARVAAEHGQASVIVTTNTFNHIGDLHDFMAGVRAFLAPEGVFAVEVPGAIDLVRDNEFDTIYHEHVNEFSVKSCVDLYRFFGMHVFDVHPLPIHGGSMRVLAQHDGGPHAVQPVVEEYLAREREARLFDQATYDAFADRVRAMRTELVGLLKRLKGEGKRLAGYGAPAKGNTLLNYFEIGPDLLDFLADRSDLKQGLYSPGMHIPVVPPERILETRPDYLLVLAWNFADEIMRQQAEWRRGGGKFILPIPRPHVVE